MSVLPYLNILPIIFCMSQQGVQQSIIDYFSSNFITYSVLIYMNIGMKYCDVSHFFAQEKHISFLKCQEAEVLLCRQKYFFQKTKIITPCLFIFQLSMLLKMLLKRKVFLTYTLFNYLIGGKSIYTFNRNFCAIYKKKQKI